jgi:hypothetical protein
MFTDSMLRHAKLEMHLLSLYTSPHRYPCFIGQIRISFFDFDKQVCLNGVVYLSCSCTNVLACCSLLTLEKCRDWPLRWWVGSPLLQAKRSRYPTYLRLHLLLCSFYIVFGDISVKLHVRSLLLLGMPTQIWIPC